MTDDLRGSAWIAAMSIALLAASQWLSATSVEYLAVGATATAIAAAITFGMRSSPVRWGVAAVAALAGGFSIAAVAQSRFARLESAWADEAARLRSRALTRLDELVVREVGDLQLAANEALLAPPDRAVAFEYLRATSSVGGPDVVLYRGDSAFAWTGRPRIRTDQLTDSVGVTGAPFYLTLYATARSGTQRVVATRLLSAAPPADRMVESLSARAAAASGVAGFRFVPPSDSASLPAARVVVAAGRALFAMTPELPSVGQVRLRLLERARLRLGGLIGLTLACFVVVGWRLRRGLRWRGVMVAVAIACVALAPLSSFSNFSRLFDPALYYTRLGGPLTANAAALALTSAATLLILLAAVRRQARVADRRIAVVIVLLVTGLGPFLLRDLARGIQIPPSGVTASLWLIWEVPLFLAATAVILTGAAAGSAVVGRTRGLPPFVAPALAVFAAVLAPIVWGAPGQFPWWYTFLWIAAIASLAVSRRSAAVVVSAAAVAALGAATLVWGATTRSRVRMAELDITTLGAGNDDARALADRLASRMLELPASSRRGLLERYATSELAAAGFPVWLGSWRADNSLAETLAPVPLVVPVDALRPLVARARASGSPVRAELPGYPATEYAIAILTDSGVVTIVVAPRTRLTQPDPFARLLGVEVPPEAEPPYVAQTTPVTRPPAGPTRASWRREGNELHGDWIAATGAGSARTHVEVDLRSLDSLVQRGTLIALLNLAIVALLWLTSVVADGVAARWISVRWRRWSRSYRIRLTVALFGFFMIPAIAFAVWSYRQLSADAARSRELLVRETLRSVAPAGSASAWITRESRRVSSPLFLYSSGELLAAGDSLLEDLAPIGRFLDPQIAAALLVHGEVTAHREENIGGASTLFAYRAMEVAPGVMGVLAAPARTDELALGRRARDLGVLVLFATAVGAMAALWLSGIAAKQLARPIGSLRQAALALAGGQREPALEGQPTTEFLPVFAAFRRMVSDLEASRLVQARAERVLAWGEMARQVAHEIKNPLTPIRLGVQHLRRARSDSRVDFDHVLEQNVERILREIDRLDEIARAFSRYGQPPEQRGGAEPTDVAAVLRDLVELETMGEGSVRWSVAGADRPVQAQARRDELREVLLNILENGRLAHATEVRCAIAATDGRVTIDVRDNGQGIAAAVLPRIFEPHFSTRTSGSGLGLAISRRLIESWGGTIDIASEEGKGATVTIQLLDGR